MAAGQCLRFVLREVVRSSDRRVVEEPTGGEAEPERSEAQGRAVAVAVVVVPAAEWL